MHWLSVQRRKACLSRWRVSKKGEQPVHCLTLPCDNPANKTTDRYLHAASAPKLQSPAQKCAAYSVAHSSCCYSWFWLFYHIHYTKKKNNNNNYVVWFSPSSDSHRFPSGSESAQVTCQFPFVVLGCSLTVCKFMCIVKSCIETKVEGDLYWFCIHINFLPDSWSLPTKLLACCRLTHHRLVQVFKLVSGVFRQLLGRAIITGIKWRIEEHLNDKVADLWRPKILLLEVLYPCFLQQQTY